MTRLRLTNLTLLRTLTIVSEQGKGFRPQARDQLVETGAGRSGFKRARVGP